MPAADCRKKLSFLLGGVEAADRELLFNVLAFLDGLAEQPLLPVYLIPLLERQVLRTNYVRGYCKEEFCSGLDANSRHLFEFAYGRFKLGEGNIKVAKVFYGVAHEYRLTPHDDLSTEDCAEACFRHERGRPAHKTGMALKT